MINMGETDMSREIRVTNKKILADLLPQFDLLKEKRGLALDSDVIAFLLREFHSKQQIGKHHEAFTRINEVVATQMAKNRDSEDWVEKRCITSAWLQKTSGCNFTAIQEWFKQHSDEISQHHRDCGLNEGHNRRVLAEMKRRAKTGRVYE